VGLIPLVHDTVVEAIRQSRVVVIIQPCQLLKDEGRARDLERYIADGGRVLILAASDHVGSVEGFCARQGLTFSEISPAESVPVLRFDRSGTESDRELLSSRDVWAGVQYEVWGGQAIVVDGEGRALVAGIENSAGGQLIVGVIADVFCNDTLGSADYAPDAAQRELYEVEYVLLAQLRTGMLVGRK
jgi:hypothetical protein